MAGRGQWNVPAIGWAMTLKVAGGSFSAICPFVILVGAPRIVDVRAIDVSYRHR